MATLLPARLDLKSSDGDKWTEKTPHSKIVRALIHLASTVRPDAAFAVRFFALSIHCPSNTFWTAGKHPLRYLKETKALGLKYGANDDGVIKRVWMRIFLREAHTQVYKWIHIHKCWGYYIMEIEAENNCCAGFQRSRVYLHGNLYLQTAVDENVFQCCWKRASEE